MMTVAHPQVGHRFDRDHVIAAVIAVLVTIGVVLGAAVVTDWPFSFSDTEVTRTFQSPSYETLDHAGRVAEVSRRLHALENVSIAVPSMASEVAEDIALLELVTTGQLPVEAAERAPVTP